MVKNKPPKNNNLPIWQADKFEISQSNLADFCLYLRKNNPDICHHIHDYDTLHHFSVTNTDIFYREFWHYANIIGDIDDTQPIITHAEHIRDTKFFAGTKLNFCENILTKIETYIPAQKPTLIFQSEDKISRDISCADTITQTKKIASFLYHKGIQPGDVIGGYLPNMPESIISMLATAAIGAVWTSCSPDFGIQGVLDRFGQTKPKVLFTCDYYFYNGKKIDIRHKVKDIITALPSLDTIILLSIDGGICDMIDISQQYYHYHDIIIQASADFTYHRYDFDHPLFIMYTSGTTGKPKSIVHRTGGILLNLLKEHYFNTELKPHDHIFYFTTLGWMMWNWLLTGLGRGACLMLYDGSPFAPDANILFDYAEKWHMTHFGTSAKYCDTLRKNNFLPQQNLSSLRCLLSTGSPLLVETYHYIHDNIKENIHIASISGGTDILGCFLGGTLSKPVYAGQLQVPVLAMDIRVLTSDGHHADISEKGELVCHNAFINMPLCFWNDDDGKKYYHAYFATFDNIWHHGDFIEKTLENGFIIHGRSDATLNPGGVRIGTAEIYRQIESFSEINNALVIGQEYDGDVRIILFIVMKGNHILNDALIKDIKQKIHQQCSPRHVPAKILMVKDIPITRSGKISELVVRDIIHGHDVKNSEALANPESLKEYKDIRAILL